MTTKTIPLTTVSIQSARPTTRYGQPAILPLSNVSKAIGLVRASLTGIPANAVISSAVVTVWSRGNPWAGTHTIYARRAVGAFSTATTYNTRPGDTAVDGASATYTNPGWLRSWNLDVTTIAQGWVTGVFPNYGLRLYTGDASVGQLCGSTAAGGKPQLVVTYLVPASAPTGLNPASGAVSKDKPTLTFNAGEDTTAIQVQVDPAANYVTPAYDSGEVPATAGLLDLSTATVPYAGLADGASTQWRARVKNPLGWSEWSSWVEFTREAWQALTITSPGATSEDPSPVVTATYAGTATAWRVLTRNSAGTVLQDSGWTPGAEVSYGTTKSVGSSGTAEVWVRDDVVRDTTPGDPDYLVASQAFTVAASGVPSPFTDVSLSQEDAGPLVTITATRAAGIPDEVAVYRGGVLVDRVPGTGTPFVFRDRTAPMNTPALYSLRAIVNGQWSAEVTASIVPRCLGVWIIDTESDDAVLLLGTNDAGQSEPEVAILHRPLSPTSQVVRRRLARAPREGDVSGTLVDALGITAATSEATLREWAELDAGHLYRLVLGNQNDQVILGDISLSEVPGNGPGKRIVAVAANWWVQG